MRIEIPELALLILVGPAGAGKTTFARTRFKPTEVISSDFCRALIADDEADQSATPAAFQVLHLIAGLRLRRRRLTVIDAVNARPIDRRPLLTLAGAHDTAAVALVFDLPEQVCVARDRARPGRSVGSRVIRAQREAILRSLPALPEEGFDAVHVFDSTESMEAAILRRAPLPVNRRWERGPFDIIGDVHGRLPDLVELLRRLGYEVGIGPSGDAQGVSHPDERKVLLVGDLVGPGRDSSGVVRLVMATTAAGRALCVRGDQDALAVRAGTVKLPEGGAAFLEGLPSHYVLAGGSLVVTHAGILPEMVGRDTARIRAFCLHGQAGWQQKWRGRALVVHGHSPVACVRWQGRTVDLDTGGAGGGRLTALRYPELEIVS
ncbi:MAG TPA: AAA family ATPase [Candidatus Dormibacteraeota bacterium]|nr:AAA family ATPase [Candidatus Dormibacteraeota bacterium]